MMRSQERPGSVETGLDLVEHQQRPVAAAERLRPGEIIWRRNPNSGFALDWLQDKCRDGPCGKLPFERLNVAERDRFRVRQEGSESSLPELVRHERERAAGQSMEAVRRIKKA